MYHNIQICFLLKRTSTMQRTMVSYPLSNDWRLPPIRFYQHCGGNGKIIPIPQVRRVIHLTGLLSSTLWGGLRSRGRGLDGLWWAFSRASRFVGPIAGFHYCDICIVVVQ